MKLESSDRPTTIHLSLDWLKLISIALACLGAFIAFRMAWAQLTHARDICLLTNGMDCELVVRSIYARIGPLPVVYLGLLGYLVILGALIVEARFQSGKLVVFGLTLFGFLFSAYLTAIQAFVLRVWCPPCEISALAMILLFIVSSIRIWRLMNSHSAEETIEDEVA